MVQSALRFSDPGTPTGMRSVAQSACTTADDGQLGGFPSALGHHNAEGGDEGGSGIASPGCARTQARSRLAPPSPQWPLAGGPPDFFSRSLQGPAGAHGTGYRGVRKSQIVPLDDIRIPTAAASASASAGVGHDSDDDDGEKSGGGAGSLGEPEATEPSPEPGVGPSSARSTADRHTGMKPPRVGTGIGGGGGGGDGRLRSRSDAGGAAASWHPGQQLGELRVSATSQSATDTSVDMLSSLEHPGALGGHAGVMGGEGEPAEPTANGGLFKLFKGKNQKKNQILPIPGKKGARSSRGNNAADVAFKNLGPPAVGRASMPARLPAGSPQPLDYEALHDSDDSPDEDGGDGGDDGAAAQLGEAGGGDGGSAQEDDTCPVCLDESPNVVLRKCGHRLCLGCAQDLCKRHVLTPVLCPYCRSVIAGFTGAAMGTPPATAAPLAVA
jgi:hypothetical protein